MLALEEIQEPHDEVELVQPQVVAYWERDCLGKTYINLHLYAL